MESRTGTRITSSACHERRNRASIPTREHDSMRVRSVKLGRWRLPAAAVASVLVILGVGFARDPTFGLSEIQWMLGGAILGVAFSGAVRFILRGVRD